MRVARTSAALLLAASSAGCAVTASAAMESRWDGFSQMQVVGDPQRLQFAKQVQISLPARLAVREMTWKQEHQARMVDALSEDRATWRAAEPLAEFDERGRGNWPTFDQLRECASRQQADLMFVYDVEVEDDDDVNALGILKLLLLPMLFVPSEEHDVSVRVRGAVADVRNGLVYASVEERREESFTTSAAAEDARVRRGVREMVDDAAEEIAKDLAIRLRDR
ncbi:MAG: hypothetical protein HMLKMBBP_03433 [Planctomycetes bacterium]|nr:hypothetical protein [Planctomycetota bacterium]